MKNLCYLIATGLGTQAIPKHFQALAKELARRGHRVILLADHKSESITKYQDNPSVYIWPSHRPTQLRDGLLLAKVIRRHRPDCLIANFGSVNAMMVVGWLSGVRNRMVWYHTLSSQIERDNTMPLWKLKLLRIRKKLCL